MRHQPSPSRAASRPCSDRFYQLERASKHELEKAFLRGSRPSLASLIGSEFRGCNHTPLSHAAGIKKFIKGFYRRDGQACGYNCPVKQNGVGSAWIAKPSDNHPKIFGHYQVVPVAADSVDNAYLHALLLDYSLGGNPALDPSRGLRDYLVQVDPDNPDLYLGKAYYALGRRRIPLSFFIIERHRPGLKDVSIR